MRQPLPDSVVHSAIANIAQFLETHLPQGSYGFLDSGEMLEIPVALLEQCRQYPEWGPIEQQYNQADCSIYCPDAEVDIDFFVGAWE